MIPPVLTISTTALVLVRHLRNWAQEGLEDWQFRAPASAYSSLCAGLFLWKPKYQVHLPLALLASTLRFLASLPNCSLSFKNGGYLTGRSAG